MADRADEPLPNWPWLLVLTAAIAVRVWGLSGQSLTMDEWFEIELAHHGPDRILFEGDGFPPLYNLILSAVIQRCGDGAARWLSVLLSLLALPVIASVGSLLGGRRAGFWSAAIVAIMPLNVWYAQEARAYSLMLLASALCLWCAVRICKRDPVRRDWWALGVCVTFGIYVHYFFIFLPMMLGLTILVCRGKQMFRPLLLTAAGVVIAGVPWLLFLKSDFETQVAWPDKSSFDVASLCYTYFSFLGGYALGPSLRELHFFPLLDSIRSVLPWASAIGVGVLLVIVGASRPVERSKLFWGLLVVPLLVGIACNVGNVGYHARYLCWCHLVVALCLGMWMAKRARPLASWIGAAVLVVVFCVAISNRSLGERYRNEEANAVATFVKQTDPHPIVVVSGYLAPVIRYYLDEDWQDNIEPLRTSYTTDTWELWRISNYVADDDRVRAFQSIVDHLPTGTQTWFVYTRSFHEDKNGQLFQAMEQAGTMEFIHHFAGATLYLVELGQP